MGSQTGSTIHVKFVLGPIPSSSALSPSDEGWTPLREPSSGRFAVQVLVLSLPLLILAIVILLRIKGNLRAQPVQLVALLSYFVLMIPVHELIHAFAYPSRLRSQHLVIGAWVRRGLCYVVYDSPLRRNRVLLMLLAPFIVFSISLVLVMCFAPSDWRLLGALAILVHSAVCIGDFLTIFRIVRQLPPDSFVLNDGWATYWTLSPNANSHDAA